MYVSSKLILEICYADQTIQNKDKLPLGKLSKATLKAGFSYLQELEDLIRDPKIAKKKYDTTHKAALEQVSNKYYTAIPHVTGRTAPPTIDTNDMLAAEVVMLVGSLQI